MTALFVTGMQRSGTTLLEKLLATAPGVSLLSQPFPLVLVEAKRRFLASLGHGDDPLPLGHLFDETRYSPAALAAFLDAFRPGAATLAPVFARMADWSGQYTRFPADAVAAALGQLPAADFAATLDSLCTSLACPRDAPVRGCKETLGEEFLPHLLAHGWRAVVIVRDPRDVLASLNHGSGERHAGAVKPTLLNLRNWRKSAAFVLELEGRPGFAWLRYEDLVARPDSALAEVSAALGLPALAVPGELRDPLNEPWRGNSSFGERRGVDAGSVGTHRNVLPSGVARFTVAACRPELLALGYRADVVPEEVATILREFGEPYPITRSGVARDLATPANLAREVRRQELLAARSDEASPLLPPLPRARRRLREALAP